MSTVSILLGAFALLSLFVVLLYNGLVRARNMVREGLAGIDVQLTRRAELIPNVVAAVKGYAAHEKELLSRVTELRAASQNARTTGERLEAEGQLSGVLGRLLAVAENYPDLKASQNFLDLSQTLAATEEQLQLSRRYYNGAVRDLNIKIESFPSNLLARNFGFIPAPFFEVEEPAKRQAPTVEFR